jgi:calcineurin-like phosphoesterase family protein
MYKLFAIIPALFLVMFIVSLTHFSHEEIGFNDYDNILGIESVLYANRLPSITDNDAVMGDFYPLIRRNPELQQVAIKRKNSPVLEVLGDPTIIS